MATAPPPTAAPTGPPSATAAPRPEVALLTAACDPPAPATFEGRFAELGYVAYRTCRGTVRVEGEAPVDLEVWVDGQDAAGVRRGSCRQPVATFSLHPGNESPWSATCPILAAETGFAVRFTDRAGGAVTTRDARPR